MNKIRFLNYSIIVIISLLLFNCSNVDISSTSSNLIDRINEGTITANCELSCSWEFGGNRRKAKRYYLSGDYDSLLKLVASIGYKNNLSHYYIGWAYEKKGNKRLAKKFYTSAKYVLKCDGFLNTCDGVNVPDKIEKGLKRISLSETEEENTTFSVSNQNTIKIQNKNNNENRPLASFSDTTICITATKSSGKKLVWNYKNDNFVYEAKYRGLNCDVKEQNKKLKQSKIEKKLSGDEIGSGFYVSKFRHIVTNQHVVNQCKKITVGDSMSTQIPADLIASDKRNDLAILQTVSMEMASADTKSFIQNLSIQIVPIVSGGLIRAEDVKGGEQIYVAGFPHGNMISDSMRLVPGLVNSTRGFENDITQFETDAVIRKGNSGGPVYDSKGNIIGMAVKRFNVTRSDNYNFAIKGSTVKQFLDANNIMTKPADRLTVITSTKIFDIASKQTVMIVCHR